MNIERYYFSLQQKKEELIGRLAKGEKGYIYVFHDIDGTNNSMDKNIWMTPNNFGMFINCIQKQYEFRALQKLDVKEYEYAYITFDDMFESAYLNAVPYLSKRGIPFTCFISPNLINQKGYIKEKQLKELSMNSLCTIGAHTVNHKLLRRLSKEESYDEIMESKIKLQNMIGTRIDLFAFPYGSKYAVASKDIENCRKCGFKYGFSTYNIALNKKHIEKGKYFLPRINVNNYNSLQFVGRMEA